MKCHFIYDQKYGKVLIPGCWGVAVHNNMNYCTCRNKIESFAQFEKKQYTEILLKKNQEIKELEKEIACLNRIIAKLIKQKNHGSKRILVQSS